MVVAVVVVALRVLFVLVSTLLSSLGRMRGALFPSNPFRPLLPLSTAKIASDKKTFMCVHGTVNEDALPFLTQQTTGAERPRENILFIGMFHHQTDATMANERC